MASRLKEKAMDATLTAMQKMMLPLMLNLASLDMRPPRNMPPADPGTARPPEARHGQLYTSVCRRSHYSPTELRENNATWTNFYKGSKLPSYTLIVAVI